MANITRTQYVNLINTLRSYPAGRSPAVSGTDITRAGVYGITAVTPSTLPTATQAEIDGNTDPTAADIFGSDIRNLTQSKATIWSKVRTLRYQLDGDLGGSQYTRAAYLTAPALTSSVPPTSNALFDPLDTKEDVDLAAFNVILSTLKVVVDSDASSEYPTLIHYCHSQCHSSCHSSRGRR